MSSVHQTFDHHDHSIRVEDVLLTWNSMREECPVGRSEKHGGFWVVTGHAEVRDLLSDNEHLTASEAAVPGNGNSEVRALPVGLDPPEHSKYRSLLLASFSPGTAKRYAEPLRVAINEMIDDFIEDGGCELYEAVAVRLPAALAAMSLGVPLEDAPKLRYWVEDQVHGGAADPEVGRRAQRQVLEYFRPLLQQRSEDPSGDDMISVLIRSEVDGERLTQDELLGFCMFLLIASLDTTQKHIGSMFWHLARDPELRHRLATESDILPTAVEEFLRYWGPVMNARMLVGDVEIGGQVLKAGDRVLFALGAANHDERVFEDAEEFIPDRSPNRHMAFGAGVHRCLGAHFVRMELRVLLEEFLRRIPDFEIADPSSVKWTGGQVQGVTTLHLRFPPGQREGTRMGTAARGTREGVSQHEG